MSKRSFLYLLGLAFLTASCSTSLPDSAEGDSTGQQSAAFEPIEFEPLNLAGSETLSSLRVGIDQVRSTTSDVRATLAPLLYLLPEGDYGIDQGWIFAVDSQLEHTAGRSWRGGEYEISMNAMYQTETSSYEDVVARVKASTFTTVRSELVLSIEGEASGSDLGVQVTATEMVFFSPDGVSEKFTVVVKKDDDHPGIVEIGVTYSLSPDSDAELQEYVEKFSGWAQMYPTLEGGQIAKIGFGTNEFSYGQWNLGRPEDEIEEPTVSLAFTYEYEYRPNYDDPLSEEYGQQTKEASELELIVRGELLLAGWSIVEGGILSETFTATAPDGTEHGVTVDPFSGSTAVRYVHRAEVAAAVR